MLHITPLQWARVARSGLCILLLTLVTCVAPGAQQPPVWIRAGLNTNLPVWGVPGRLLWGLPPHAGKLGGPRGLIRLYYPVLPKGGYDLINFIAVEPIVGGRKGFSELEPSSLDQRPGKRFWAFDPGSPTYNYTNPPPGKVVPERGPSLGQAMQVRIGIERFENGAHVFLTATQRSDRPDELELRIRAEPDSAPIEYCILTATMGNKARARNLWLKGEVVSSLKLYPHYQDHAFAPHSIFARERLLHTPAGEVLAAITTNEADPASVDPSPAKAHWKYSGIPVTQYWKKPAGTIARELHVAVNARYTYWMSTNPIPGGIAFENFEMREPFRQDQSFTFGITPRSPADLGFQAE